MQRSHAFCTRFAVRGFAVAGLWLWSSMAGAQVSSGDSSDPPTNPLAGFNIVKIEEDWLLDIANPDPDADCPQVVTVFGPSDPDSGTHANFELNHGTQPEFAEGGMQLQAWYGEYLIGYHSQFAPAEFNQAIERLTFTTQIRVRDNMLKLAILNGQSLTWGPFGGSSNLRIDMSTWRNDLNDWNSQYSIANSRVSYGANRVNKFLRTEIRYYTRDNSGQYQLVYTDETDTYIHRLDEDNFAPDPLNGGDSPIENGLGDSGSGSPGNGT
jgi:hypothetical protein